MYQVTKRNGKKEELDTEKINKMLIWATDSISGVSASDIAMNAKLQFYSGMKTEEIHDILIQSAVDLISEKTPNYQYVAGNLLNYLLRKQVLEYKNGDMPHLWTVTSQNIKHGVYDHIILDKYNTEELSVLNLYIKHKRDYDFTYAGIQQLIDKYLIKDRSTGKIYETPQYAYMLIAMTVFMDWKNPDERLHHVKKLYDLMSLQKISLPTPILAGIRTPNRQYSSCTLIEIGDSLDSIFASNTAIGQYVAKRAGIGLNAGSLRAKGSKIRNGEVVHTGVVPFFKMFQSVMGSCSQGGIRKGSATLYFPWWHKEIEDVLVLKNNKGTDDNRVRHIDYGIQFSRLFYKRFLDNQEIALFSPGDAPGLYEAFGNNEKFDELYLKYEKDKKVVKKVVKARDLMNQFAQERLGTGRMYVMNIDHANTNSPWNIPVRQSNLCAEVILPTSPIESIYDIDQDSSTEEKSKGEIALCVLGGHNLGNIKSWEELYECSEYLVRLCDFVVEHQDYPINASRKMLKRRSIGIGVTNFAYWLAKNNLTYSGPEALEKVDELFEHFQFSLLKASNLLAQESGACEWFKDTSYADGVLPIDRYNKNVDTIVKRELSCDWEGLREDIKQFGLRNSVVSCQFPAESSSVVQGATNGIEPIRSLVISKKSKSGIVKMVAPEMVKLKNKYELAFDMPSNQGYSNIVSVIQKWMDQSISANHYYNATGDGISIAGIIKDILYSYKMGMKTIYYANTNDSRDNEDTKESKEDVSHDETTDEAGCESGACSV